MDDFNNRDLTSASGGGGGSSPVEPRQVEEEEELILDIEMIDITDGSSQKCFECSEDRPDIALAPFTPSASSGGSGSSVGGGGNFSGSHPDSTRFQCWTRRLMRKRNAKSQVLVAPTCATANEYNMTHLSRGNCLIFNHKTFSPDQGLEARCGTDEDVAKIVETFTKLGFNIHTYNDLLHDHLHQVLQQTADDDHTNEDCILIFILTHGHLEDELHAFDRTYKTSKLCSYFTADKCQTLAGKPKMFFVQGCRGDKFDDGTDLMKRKFPRTEVDGPFLPGKRTHDQAFRIPNHADFLTVFSTVAVVAESVDFLSFTIKCLSLGYFAWRNSRTGSCFIAALCKTFNEHAASKDVLSMLTLVNRAVAIDYESHCKNPEQSGKKQVPQVRHTLTREIHLKPKITNVPINLN